MLIKMEFLSGLVSRFKRLESKMDAEKILNLLLDNLPLDPKTKKDIRMVLQVILDVIRELWGPSFGKSCKKASIDEIEDTAKKLGEMIAFFKKCDEHREKFLKKFPDWKEKRNNNIKQLEKIAESLKEKRQICSVAQIVGGSVGVVGGVAIIGSILFPPAAPALLPAWLGGAAATALLPSFLLPTVAATTSGLAVGGAVAAGAGGVAQVATSVTEAILTKGLIDDAKEVYKQDSESFKAMSEWFKHTAKLDEAMADLFRADILEVIFEDLKDYIGEFSMLNEGCKTALRACIAKIFGKGFRINPYLELATTAIGIVVFLAQKRNRFLFQCIILTHRLGFGLMGAMNAAPQFGRLVASAFVKEVEMIPRAVASKVAVGVFAGLGIALDAANIIINSIDLAEGSKSEMQEKVLNVSKELEKELELIKSVYNEIRKICGLSYY